MDGNSSSQRLGAAPGRGKLAVAVEAIVARYDTWRASRRERTTAERLGAELAGEGTGGVRGHAVREARSRVLRLQEDVTALRDALAASLDEDRRDYADARSWLRPLVVARGIATRCLLRDRLRRKATARRLADRALGRAALDEGIASSTCGAGIVADATEARTRALESADRLERRLAELRPTRAAIAARVATREAFALGTPLVREVRGKLVPRIPGLAGLAVGWWIASTFTDSQLTAMLHSIGIGSGARRVVSTQQLRAMEFWLPVLAAAVCSYAGSRLATAVRARYQPASERTADGSERP